MLWGSAGHAKVLASVIALCGGRVVALFDNDPQAVSVLAGVPLYIGTEGLYRWSEGDQDRNDLFGLAAIGGDRGRDRLTVHECFRLHGVRVEPLVHPQASVCLTASLGAGTQVLAHALVATDVRIGEACIINHQAAVDHESVLGSGVHLAPGAIPTSLRSGRPRCTSRRGPIRCFKKRTRSSRSRSAAAATRPRAMRRARRRRSPPR